MKSAMHLFHIRRTNIIKQYTAICNLHTRNNSVENNGAGTGPALGLIYTFFRVMDMSTSKLEDKCFWVQI